LYPLPINNETCTKLYRVFKLDTKTKTNDNISRDQQNTQLIITINIFTDCYNLQNLSCGFGVPDVAAS
jgi:hypothetical protein